MFAMIWVVIAAMMTIALGWEWWAGVLFYFVVPIPIMAFLHRREVAVWDEAVGLNDSATTTQTARGAPVDSISPTDQRPLPTPAEAVQMSWIAFRDAFATRDLDLINEWWHRLELTVAHGGFAHVQPLLDEFWDSTDPENKADIKSTAEALQKAIYALSYRG